MNMKNKKSNIPAFVSTIGLAYLLLLAGCSQDDVQTPDDGTKDGNAIRFTSTIIDFTGSDAANDPETRATINPDGTGSFTNGDQIRLWTYMVDFPDFIISDMSEMYTLTNNGNTWDGFTPTWDELGEPTDERRRFFSAHYPQQTWGSSDSEFEFSVATDQSIIEAYEASDLLEAQSRYSEKPQDGTVNLSFYHAMARVTVKLVEGSGVSAEEVDQATIILKNMAIRCTRKYSGDTETDVTLRDDIIPRKSDSSGTNTFYALVPPHSVGNGLEIEITVSGKVISYKTMELKYLVSGNEYLITLTLTNSGGGVSADSGSGDNYSPGGGIDY
ncbi:fimbrillin family protein [Butyricimonas faecalis]|uniref:Fimbrillin family protein n=2 Tax=Butyricimonas faecalis TaxID=2093856 RepID=A0A3Q9IQF1_9BACT|nr:fimbrillin family protein [Butyricimonas faecalis]